MSGAVTPDDVNRAIVLAWIASLFIAAALTFPVFLLHRRLIGGTNMHVLAAVVAITCLLAVYFLAGMSLMRLVSFQLNRLTADSDTKFSITSIYYHPGFAIKLSLVGVVIITWAALTLRNRRIAASSRTVA
jgi:hypothetical protein